MSPDHPTPPAPGLLVLETERLLLRRLTLDDAPLILRLVNEPAWLRYIGDRGIRTLDDSRAYLEKGPLAMYRQRGFGLYRVETRADGVPIGICGLIKRDTFADVDLGFALLSEQWSRGYAYEAAAGTLRHGREALGLRRILAITSQDNEASIRLLTKLGFRFEHLQRLTEGAPEVRLYVSDP